MAKFPIDNLSYNLITVIHEKCKALEAYDQYMKDLQGDKELVRLFEDIRRSDEQFVKQLQQHLHRTMMQQKVPAGEKVA
jgi:hypothetical protein